MPIAPHFPPSPPSPPSPETSGHLLACCLCAKVLALLLALGQTPAAAQQPLCAPVLAQVVALSSSVPGSVQWRRSGSDWLDAQPGSLLCAGDTVRVLRHGQATLRLSNDSTLRLDQFTTLVLAPPDSRRATLIEQLSGRLHVMTRTPRAFSIKTPFVNANVQGTEFAVLLEADRATVAVVEGQVEMANQAGSLLLGPGQGGSAAQGQAPRGELGIRPADAVAWALYVPAVLEPVLADADLSGTNPPSAAPAAARWLSQRAAMLLQLGQLEEATPLLAQALQRQPGHSAALALQAVVAVARNNTPLALALARQAQQNDPASAGALIALSYAEQARFQLPAALDHARLAVQLAPSNALAQARRAELALSLDLQAEALAAARQAVQLRPGLARSHSVLGFAHLTRGQTAAARAAFEQAIALDPADPQPRLGLGLARIRAGALAEGREQIEIATMLDPGRSLLRSYLGKAYHEEGRDARAATQFALARERDPQDPTPELYSALMAQSQQQPVTALLALERAVALNDQRAVQRSRQLLDQDLAARAVSQAQIYRALGFDQLAVLQAATALNLDPTDASAHRFLADGYQGQLRTEAARSAELLQAQLRQGLGLNQLQPLPLRGAMAITESLAPGNAGGWEFSPLFTRNQLLTRLDAVVGHAGQRGGQLFVSGLHDALAYSLVLGQQRSDGLRANNDQTQTLGSAFVQWAATPSLRLQAEWRDERVKQGDLSSRFDRDDFHPTLRDDLSLRSLRLGAYWQISPRSELLASAVAGRGHERLYLSDSPNDGTDDRERLQSLELQYAQRGAAYVALGGLSAYRNRISITDVDGSASQDIRESTAYGLLSLTGLHAGLVPQLGLSLDQFEQPGLSIRQWSPKLGLVWTLAGGTTLRLAAFKGVKRSFVANQTLQPSQFAGFNQFFDDPNGSRYRRVGLGVDQRLSAGSFVGAEWSRRQIDVPGFVGEPDFRWTERMARIYVYQLLGPGFSATAELQHEALRRPPEFTDFEGFTVLDTVFLPLGLRWHGPGPWSAGIKLTAVHQRLRYEDRHFDLQDGRSNFVVADLSLAYRLPNRAGQISLEARNLFNQQHRYQELTFFSSPRLAPGRLVLLRGSLVF